MAQPTDARSSGADDAQQGAGPGGLYPSQRIRRLIEAGAVRTSAPLAPDQVQPASLDLRLGTRAWRVRASFLAGTGHTVADRLARMGMHEIDLTRGAVFERGCVYVVELLESLDLPPGITAFANPKSSIGRLDVFTRLITDRGTAFDRVDPDYRGPLYAEVAPRTFSIVARTGSRLNQLRFRDGAPALDAETLRRLQARRNLIGGSATIRDDATGSIGVSLDLEGAGNGDLVGWRARKFAGLIDVDLKNHYEPLDFWEPIRANPRSPFILDPDDFYILVTRETVSVPADHAAEMIAYDTLSGEFRVHYAGFFDPGFGTDGSAEGSRAVLEVRSHEVPFVIEHGQLVGWLKYERLSEAPDLLYGAGMGSHYQGQKLRLAKHFRKA
jgi:dCTP deaminase